MNKLLKTSLIALAGIMFFGVNYAATSTVYAAAPTIKVFTVTPDPATAGTNIAITWQSDADNCYLGGDPWASFPGGESPAQTASGSWNQAQAINTGTTPRQMTVKIRCENIALAGPDIVTSSNENTYQEKTITVNPAGTAPVITLSTDPAQIPKGATTMNITWSSSKTDSNGCTASGPGWTGQKPSSGMEPITATPGTYKLTCTGPGGSTSKEISVGLATTAGEMGSAAPGTSTTDLSKLVCLETTGPVPTGINVGACVAQTIYYVIYIPTSWLLYGAGFIFDTAITLSIDKSFIVKPFIAELWTVIRNFSNMIFIFILLYTGVMTMLGMGDWRKTVINVVVIALLINFSLFFTKIVIDAGNVLATGVYSSMGAEKDRQTTKDGTLKERDISAALVKGFNPQSFIGNTPFDKPLDAIVVFFIAAAVSVFTAYIFFKAAMLFIGRLLAFWYLMIISPFAFTSIVLPKGNMFNSWTDDLLNQAFVAPVFLFFIYIIMKIISTNVLAGMLNASNAGVGDFFFNKLIVPVIFAAMIIFALQKTLKVAEGMAGEFGSAISQYASKALGAAVTVASGGASLAAGGIASSVVSSGKLQNLATSESKIARGFGKLGLLGADKAQNATFDPRNIGGGVGKSLGLGAGNKLDYTKQTKTWRDYRENQSKKMANLIEEPQKAIAQEEREAEDARQKLEVAKEQESAAEKGAANTESGKNLINARKAEKEAGDVAKKALEEETKMREALEKLVQNSSAPADLMNPGKKQGQVAAEQALSDATNAKVAAEGTHKAKKNETSAAEDTFTKEEPEHAKRLAATKKAREDQEKISEMKNKDLKTAQDERIAKNEGRRLAYARQVARQGFTQGARDRSRARADKVRKDNAEAKKQKKEEENAAKILLKALKEQQKDGSSAPTPPPAAPKK